MSQVGGLGLVDASHEHDLEKAFATAAKGHVQVGISLSADSLAQQPALLQQALSHKPRALMLPSGDHLVKLAPLVKAAGIPFICKCSTLDCVKKPLQAGATVIVSHNAANTR